MQRRNFYDCGLRAMAATTDIVFRKDSADQMGSSKTETAFNSLSETAQNDAISSRGRKADLFCLSSEIIQ